MFYFCFAWFSCFFLFKIPIASGIYRSACSIILGNYYCCIAQCLIQKQCVMHQSIVTTNPPIPMLSWEFVFPSLLSAIPELSVQHILAHFGAKTKPLPRFGRKIKARHVPQPLASIPCISSGVGAGNNWLVHCVYQHIIYKYIYFVWIIVHLRPFNFHNQTVSTLRKTSGSTDYVFCPTTLIKSDVSQLIKFINI
jgi:hypothetical protein